MNWTYCNASTEETKIVEDPLPIGITFHHLGLILTALFGLLAVLISLYLIFMHATHYSKPQEQKAIIRILFMVPIYSVVSFISYADYRQYVYFEVIRECYEAFAIASFFWLMCHFVAPDLRSQKDYFRELDPIKPWLWPVTWMAKCCGGPRGCTRVPRSGLTWFNIIWFAVFQYCFVRVFCTFMALIAQATGRYCVDSLSPLFAHVWIAVLEATAVTFAMYFLIQFYYQVRQDIADQRPFLKLLAIKLVIFFSFWQTIILSFLSSAGAIPPSPRIAIQDIKLGIPVILLCLEMFLFAILHIWAYPWKDYSAGRGGALATAESGAGNPLEEGTLYKGGVLGWRAYLDAFNPWDMIKAIARGFRWVFVGRRMREQDVSYEKWRKAGGATAGGGAAGDVPLQDARPPGTFGSGKGARYVPLGEGAEAGAPQGDYYDAPLQPPPMYSGAGEVQSDTAYHGAHNGGLGGRPIEMSDAGQYGSRPYNR